MQKQTGSFYEQLLVQTRPTREDFLAIPLIASALAGQVNQELYLRYLEQAYHHVKHTCPLLGMVHVLEGMSVQLATQAAGAIAANLAVSSEAGFSYLRSHGDLDKGHVKMFENLVNGIQEPAHHACIVDMADIIYRLFGEVFRALDGGSHAVGEVA